MKYITAFLFATVLAVSVSGCGVDENTSDQRLQQSEVRHNYQRFKLEQKFAQTAKQKALVERARDSVEYHRAQAIMFAHSKGYNAEHGDGWEAMLDTLSREALREYVRLQRNLSHAREWQVRKLGVLNHYLGQYQFDEHKFESWYAKNVKNRDNPVIHASQLADSLNNTDLWRLAEQKTQSDR